MFLVLTLELIALNVTTRKKGQEQFLLIVMVHDYSSKILSQKHWNSEKELYAEIEF